MDVGEDRESGAPSAGLEDVASVREEYPASWWSLKNSLRVETLLAGLNAPSDPTAKDIWAQNQFEIFKRRYGLVRPPGTFRVLMIAADTSGCGFARIERPARYLNRHPRLAAFPTVKVTPELIHWAHVIVWQRQYKDSMLPFFEMGRGLGKVQIFDIDDNLHAVPSYNPAHATYHKGTKPYEDLIRWMKRCDLVTVSKSELGEFYREFAGIRYVVLPNCIDFEEFPQANGFRGASGPVRIGWAGSTTHYEDLRIVSDVFLELKKTYGDHVELVLMGSDGIRRTGKGIEGCGAADGTDGGTDRRDFDGEDILKGVAREFHEPAPTETYGRALRGLGLDIAVIPLARSRFNLTGKSNIKYLEMSAAKIPCILSRDTVYDEVRHGETGFLAGKGREWLQCLEQLIKDRDLRRRIAGNAHRYVRAHYDFAHKVRLWAEVYLEAHRLKHGKK
jgi:glycosyltransferase involved in cell wall biosynthesis